MSITRRPQAIEGDTCKKIESQQRLTVDGKPINGNFATKDKSMESFLEKFIGNMHADALSKLTSNKDSELLKVVPIENLSRSSISKEELVIWIEVVPLWMQQIIVFP